MTTIADFRPSVSQMSEDELLNSIRNIRALRRMLPARPIQKTKTKKRTKTTDVKHYVNNLNESEKQAIVQMLLKLKGGN